FLTAAPLPRSPLFPYTTLFRSVAAYLAATFCLAIALGIVSGALFAVASDATFDGIAERIGYYSASALWPGFMVLAVPFAVVALRSEEHTSELQSLTNLVCRLLL